MTSSLAQKLAAVKVLAFDVDGVLTDGGILLGENTELLRFDVQDGSGISMALRDGYTVALLTGRRSPVAVRRAEMLGIKEMHTSVHDKRTAVIDLAARHNVPLESVLFMGDDLIDLPAFDVAGVRCAPANAIVEIRDRADYIATRPGGHGAVREVIELVMRTQGRWDAAVARLVGREGIAQ